jgi:hypothetical protein
MSDENGSQQGEPELKGFRANIRKGTVRKELAPMVLVVLIVVPLMVFGFYKGAVIAGLALLCTLSRSTPLHDRLWIEVHSLLLICISHVFGLWVGLFIVIVSTPLVFFLAPKLGTTLNPVTSLVDVPYLITLCLIASMVAPAELLFFSLATMIVVNYFTLNLVRTLVSPDPFVKRLTMSMINGALNYILISRFALYLIAALAG